MKKLFTLLLGAFLGCVLTHAATIDWTVATNVVSGATAYAASNNSSASSVVDGDTGTRWIAAEGPAADKVDWVVVDLGESKSIKAIQFDQEGACASSFDVYLLDELTVTTDDTANTASLPENFTTTYTPVATVSGATLADPVKVLVLDNATTCRYIVYYPTAYATNYQTSLWEIRATAENAALDAIQLLISGASAFQKGNTENYTITAFNGYGQDASLPSDLAVTYTGSKENGLTIGAINAGVFAVTGLRTGSYTLTATGSDVTSASLAISVTRTWNDIAQGKPMYYTKPVDGSLTIAETTNSGNWEVGKWTGDNCWVMVDLEKTYQIGDMGMQWQAAHPSSMRIYGALTVPATLDPTWTPSTLPTNFQEITDGSYTPTVIATGAEDVVYDEVSPSNPVTARYVMIMCEGAAFAEYPMHFYDWIIEGTEVQVSQTVASIVVTPSAETIYLGNTVTLTTNGFNAAGLDLGSVEATYTWSDGTNSGTITGSEFTPSAAGTYTITATYETLTATCTVTVEEINANQLVITGATTIPATINQCYQLALSDALGNTTELDSTDGITVTCSDANVAVSQVYGDATVVVNAPASVSSFTLTVSGNDYTSATIDVTVSSLDWSNFANNFGGMDLAQDKKLIYTKVEEGDFTITEWSETTINNGGYELGGTDMMDGWFLIDLEDYYTISSIAFDWYQAYPEEFRIYGANALPSELDAHWTSETIPDQFREITNGTQNDATTGRHWNSILPETELTARYVLILCEKRYVGTFGNYGMHFFDWIITGYKDVNATGIQILTDAVNDSMYPGQTVSIRGRVSNRTGAVLPEDVYGVVFEFTPSEAGTYDSDAMTFTANDGFTGDVTFTAISLPKRKFKTTYTLHVAEPVVAKVKVALDQPYMKVGDKAQATVTYLDADGNEIDAAYLNSDNMARSISGVDGAITPAGVISAEGSGVMTVTYAYGNVKGTATLYVYQNSDYIGTYWYSSMSNTYVPADGAYTSDVLIADLVIDDMTNGPDLESNTGNTLVTLGDNGANAKTTLTWKYAGATNIYLLGLRWDRAVPASYTLYSSSDNSTWTKVGTMEHEDPGVAAITDLFYGSALQNVRYLRIITNGDATQWGPKLYAIKAFGKRAYTPYARDIKVESTTNKIFVDEEDVTPTFTVSVLDQYSNLMNPQPAITISGDHAAWFSQAAREEGDNTSPYTITFAVPTDQEGNATATLAKGDYSIYVTSGDAEETCTVYVADKNDYLTTDAQTQQSYFKSVTPSTLSTRLTTGNPTLLDLVINTAEGANQYTTANQNKTDGYVVLNDKEENNTLILQTLVPLDLDMILVDWDDFISADYELLISPDGKTYTSLGTATHSAQASAIDRFAGSNMTGVRYIKIVSNSPVNSGIGSVLAWIKLYGSKFDYTPKATSVVLTNSYTLPTLRNDATLKGRFEGLFTSSTASKKETSTVGVKIYDQYGLQLLNAAPTFAFNSLGGTLTAIETTDPVYDADGELVYNYTFTPGEAAGQYQITVTATAGEATATGSITIPVAVREHYLDREYYATITNQKGETKEATYIKTSDDESATNLISLAYTPMLPKSDDEWTGWNWPGDNVQSVPDYYDDPCEILWYSPVRSLVLPLSDGETATSDTHTTVFALNQQINLEAVVALWGDSGPADYDVYVSSTSDTDAAYTKIGSVTGNITGQTTDRFVVAGENAAKAVKYVKIVTNSLITDKFGCEIYQFKLYGSQVAPSKPTNIVLESSARVLMTVVDEKDGYSVIMNDNTVYEKFTSEDTFDENDLSNYNPNNHVLTASGDELNERGEPQRTEIARVTAKVVDQYGIEMSEYSSKITFDNCSGGYVTDKRPVGVSESKELWWLKDGIYYFIPMYQGWAYLGAQVKIDDETTLSATYPIQIVDRNSRIYEAVKQIEFHCVDDNAEVEARMAYGWPYDAAVDDLGHTYYWGTDYYFYSDVNPVYEQNLLAWKADDNDHELVHWIAADLQLTFNNYNDSRWVNLSNTYNQFKITFDKNYRVYALRFHFEAQAPRTVRIVGASAISPDSEEEVEVIRNGRRVDHKQGNASMMNEDIKSTEDLLTVTNPDVIQGHALDNTFLFDGGPTLNTITIETEGDNGSTTALYRNKVGGMTVYGYPEGTTGVEDVIADRTAEGAAQAELVNVYNLQGFMVRSKVARDEALRSLPAGIYIVAGRKYLVK